MSDAISVPVVDETKTFMESDAEGDIQLKEYNITTAPNDFNVLTITSFMDNGAIVLPPYQRNFTWDKKRASKLIESLVLGLPVPQLFLYEDSKNKFSILDGQQRLMSIYFFVKKRFPRKEHRAYLREMYSEKGIFPEYILAGNEYFEDFNIDLPSRDDEPASSINGLNYDTMAAIGDLQRNFNLRPIRCIIVKQIEPKDDDSSVYEIFDRLNTGGVILNPQEIRANLYYSPFYQKLYDLNKGVDWRKLIGKSERDEKLRDVELLLRVFAMLTFNNDYKPSMTRFLNRYSAMARKKYTQRDVEVIGIIFEKFMGHISTIPISKFNAGLRFSVAIFESIFFASAKKIWLERNNIDLANPAIVFPTITENIVEAIALESKPLLQEGTTKAVNVKERLSIADRMINAPQIDHE